MQPRLWTFSWGDEELTHGPGPVDHEDLFVKLHHEDDEEDNAEGHLAKSRNRVSSIRRRSIADKDDQADELREEVETNND